MQHSARTRHVHPRTSDRGASSSIRDACEISGRAFRAARKLALILLLFAVLVSSACTQGIAWRSYSYDREARQRDAGTLSFVYFRSWYDPACTRFEDQVLMDPAVRDATRPFHCTALDYVTDEKLAVGWGLTKAPAFAIVAPNGSVVARGQGTVTAAELIGALNSARLSLANGSYSTSSPATAPAMSP